MIGVLSLGANLGDPRATITTALDSLGASVIARSSFYATSPVGGPEQPDFVNVCALVTGPSPAGFLGICQLLEAAASRSRGVRWGPRTLDVDVITVRDEDGAQLLSDAPALTLPHPRAHSRLFVLEPWAELEPEADLAGHGPIADLIAALRVDDPSQSVQAI